MQLLKGIAPYATNNTIFCCVSSENGEQVQSSSVNTFECPICERHMENAAVLILHLRVSHAGVIGEHLIQAYERMSELKSEDTKSEHMNDEGKQKEIHIHYKINVLKSHLEEKEIPSTEVEQGTATNSPPLIVSHNGSKLYRCSYCHYYTKWLSNLSVHERRHTGGEYINPN
jgi:hypothetical protein